MLKKINKLTKLPLTQNLLGYEYFENFLISSVVTIITVRSFLNITGYPQLGGEGFHIAHMLWGGFFLTISLLIALLFLDRNIRAISAVLGGVGFGLFIDELGKFITSDNNYFFQPTIALLYIILILLYLILSSIKKYLHISREEYLSNALDIFRDSIVHGFTPQEKEQIKKYLKSAGGHITINNLLSLTKNHISIKKESFALFRKTKLFLAKHTKRLASSKLFQYLIVAYIGFNALVILLSIFANLIFPLEFLPEDLILIRQNDITFASIGLMASSLFAGTLALLGFLSYPFSKYRTFIYFRFYLLFSIFIVQFFLFWHNQLGALTGLVFDIIALKAVDILLKNSQKQTKLKLVN